MRIAFSPVLDDRPENWQLFSSLPDRRTGSSIIGLIKRAQRAYGSVLCVSGVIGRFRKTALHRAGCWSIDMITEDVDLTWRLQLDHWSVLHEPNAMCWILMAESLKELWRQRLRVLTDVRDCRVGGLHQHRAPLF